MATYDKCIYDIPPYQEGNDNDWEFELDSNFQADVVTDITFQVRKLDGSVLLSKSLTGGTITFTEETITLEDDTTKVVHVVRIPIPPSDTIGKVGRHLYELDFINLIGRPYATIGGAFIINKQYNTL
ncbi:hypothetical protein JZU61_04405 [bacterium]|jgi:hypothetical protein|nr:hypothetical protein [bacterium]